MSEDPSRGPLPYIILTSTGQDVRDCINCEFCYQTFQGMDLALNEVMQAVARNDPSVLNNPILWNCDSLLQSNFTCMGGIDIPKVIYALRGEAEIRDLKP